ncbi:AAA family ATPase [Paenirhodobacter populi]|uniref:AAA family ATPase n=1 Tax=Paenirhodobacter populi TaxID=2306993 RepID=UPI0019D419FD|nr:AAA family ATPase [Sinirhodobacter populi]
MDQGQADATASSRVSSARRAEQYLGDLDERLAQDSLDNLLNQFAYTAEDARAERPNPSPVPIDGDLRTGLASLQQALKHYHAFLTEQNATPDRAAQQAQVARLTRAEIEAAMDDCDRLGLAAFLARGGFVKPQVWVAGEDRGGRNYPAKAVVAAAMGHLPGGRAPGAKQFFGGFGEPQAFARLEALGYRLLRPEAKGEENPFSRDAVEAAMDDFEEYRASGAHADDFAGFGEPTGYWVRSTRPRPDRWFPSKPIVGKLLHKPASAFSGGWSQPQTAAALLHNAGYVITDESDQPLPLPESHAHLMRGAERARLVALNYFIAPAREAGTPAVTIRVGDLHDMSGLVRNWANVCQALEGPKFRTLAAVSEPRRTGPVRGASTEYTFSLIPMALTPEVPAGEPSMSNTKPTNLILFGPPGTGKTYATAAEAVRLLCGEPVPEDHGELMKVYRRLSEEGRIEFVTFHQSMSYEDFVEGLRPVTNGDGDEPATSAGFRLKPVPGIFRRIASSAERDRGRSASALHLYGRQVYKMSIGNSALPQDAPLFAQALAEGCTIFGFADLDWSDPRFAEPAEIASAMQRLDDWAGVKPGSPSVRMTDIFRNRLKPGDILIVTRGNLLVRAVGEVTGEYEFHPRPEGDYGHRRAVRWLWSDAEGVPATEFYRKKFSQLTLYPLVPEDLNVPVLERYMNSRTPEEPAAPDPFVLIIDEINRANVSKVFGELITLLEEDKRLGCDNELRIKLPYSRERFGVPQNLHIIGTMNTADRSIALLDTALRRRFTFRELMPDPNVLSSNVDGIDLQKLLTTLNDRIEYLFDRDHQIGHAYFIRCETKEDVDDVMRQKVIPLLAEYFYEDWSKVAAVLGDLTPQEGDIDGAFLVRRRLTAPAGLAGDEMAPRYRWKMKEGAFSYQNLQP